MLSLVGHLFQHVVHGSVAPVAHVIDVGPVFQQEVHHIRVHGLAGHVQRRLVLQVLGADFCPSAHQVQTHLMVAAQSGPFLRLGAGSVEWGLTLIVVMLQLGTVAQVETDMVGQAVTAGHMKRGVILLQASAIHCSSKLKQVFSTSTFGAIKDMTYPMYMCELDADEEHIVQVTSQYC